MESLELKLQYEFKNKDLLKKSLTHRSFSVEGGLEIGYDNERLEFLGDAVLDLIVSDLLWTAYQEEAEGPLSQRRSALVSEESLAEIALELGLSEYLILGKGEKQNGGAQKPRLLACAFEALVGAIYLDSNYEVTLKIVRQLFDPRIHNQGDESNYRRDYKTRLQELIQKETAQVPVYVLEEEIGPPHDRLFKVSVRSGDRVLASGEGKSKKQAEQKAAQEALVLESASKTEIIENKELKLEEVINETKS